MGVPPNHPVMDDYDLVLTAMVTTGDPPRLQNPQVILVQPLFDKMKTSKNVGSCKAILIICVYDNMFAVTLWNITINLKKKQGDFDDL